MTITADQFKEIKRFNDNLEWLKKQSNPLNSNVEYMNMKDSMEFISRKRTWIQNRMVKNLEPDMDSTQVLVRGGDWIREGNRILFKKDSLIRIKTNVLQTIGNQYDNII
jgi:hypothetical protein